MTNSIHKFTKNEDYKMKTVENNLLRKNRGLFGNILKEEIKRRQPDKGMDTIKEIF